MLIDWFTFFAQLINFLVLVWLLKRFLYKPILKAIDEREKRIAMQLQEAESIKNEVTIELENFQQKNNEFEQHRQELLDTAKIEVDSERKRLIKKTRSDIKKLRLELEETLNNDQEKLGSDIMQRTSTEIFSIVRKTLRDLASASLEDQMTEVFINRIKNMDSSEKELLLSEISKVQDIIILRCTFGMSLNQQAKIENILKRELHREIGLKFEIAPKLVSGIELVSGAYKLVWSIDDYLLSLEKSIAELLSEKK